MYLLQKICRSLGTLRALGYQRSLITIQHRCTQKINYFMPLPSATQLPLVQFEKLFFLEKTVSYIDSNTLCASADHYAHNCFTILGAPQCCFEAIPWHTDIRLQAQNPQADCTFDAHTYYKNNVITVHHGTDLGKDIKVPWELARFQYAPILGLAYHGTHNPLYVEAAKKQIISWITANPFGYGIHWFNGMEVAIRATNWIIALQWLHDAVVHDTSFYQQLIASLYDHMCYLEHNWEWYDGRTNNHYVTNLVGYAYLCWFFKAMPGMEQKWRWCYQQLRQEFDWQIFDEGTSYEGSTRYHRLVTELFLHGFLVAQQMGESIAPLRNKLERMVLFIEHCKPDRKEDPIAIGDDDSGSLLDALFAMENWYPFFDIKLSSTPFTKYYKQFGISLCNQHDWHVSLRHHAYSKRQPTGHFHQDKGSVTIAYKGIPIIVDPGTYVYTASSYWRYYFRAAAVHNTVYTPQTKQENDLFSLHMDAGTPPDTYMQASIACAEGAIIRTVIVEQKQIRIYDQCSFLKPSLVHWHFTFAPSIKLMESNNEWSILGNTIRINYHSSLSWMCYDTWVSPRYGLQEKTVCLTASKEVTHQIIEHTFMIQ